MVTVEPLRNYMQQRIQGGQFGSVSFLSLLLNTVPVWCGQRDIFSVLDTVFCIGRFHDLTSNCVGASGSFWRLWGAAAGMAAPVSFTVYQEATGSASQEAGCSNTSFLAGALILESVLPSTGCYRFQACCKVPALSQLSEESHTTPVSVYWLGKKAKLTWILRNLLKQSLMFMFLRSGSVEGNALEGVWPKTLEWSQTHNLLHKKIPFTFVLLTSFKVK